VAHTELWSELAIGAPTVEDAEVVKQSETRILSKQESPQVGALTISVSPKAEHNVDVLNKLKLPHNKVR